MLKYIKQHMAEIVGIEIYPIISFLIFFSFFIVAAILIMKADKGFINRMSNMPLDKDNENEQK